MDKSYRKNKTLVNHQGLLNIVQDIDSIEKLDIEEITDTNNKRRITISAKKKKSDYRASAATFMTKSSVANKRSEARSSRKHEARESDEVRGLKPLMRKKAVKHVDFLEELEKIQSPAYDESARMSYNQNFESRFSRNQVSPESGLGFPQDKRVSQQLVRQSKNFVRSRTSLYKPSIKEYTSDQVKKYSLENQEEITEKIQDLVLNNNIEEYEEVVIKFHSQTFKTIIFAIGQTVNSIIRYTFFNIPWCIASLGMFYGVLVTFLIGFMSMMSTYMLMKAHKATNELSYTTMALRWWGMKGKIFCMILNMVYSFGSCLSYIIISLNVTTNVLVHFMTQENYEDLSDYFILIYGAILATFCFSNNVTSLRSSARMGFFAIIVIIILVFVRTMTASYKGLRFDSKSFQYSFFGSGDITDVNQSISIIILSQSYHSYTFSIYECIDNPNLEKMMISSAIGILLSTTVYALVGCSLYLIFGSHTLLTDDMSTILRFTTLGSIICIAYVVSTLMTFPLSFFSLKNYVYYVTPYFQEWGREFCSYLKKKCSNSADNEDSSNISNKGKGEEDVKTKKMSKKTNINDQRKSLDSNDTLNCDVYKELGGGKFYKSQIPERLYSDQSKKSIKNSSGSFKTSEKQGKKKSRFNSESYLNSLNEEGLRTIEEERLDEDITLSKYKLNSKSHISDNQYSNDKEAKIDNEHKNEDLKQESRERDTITNADSINAINSNDNDHLGKNLEADKKKEESKSERNSESPTDSSNSNSNSEGSEEEEHHQSHSHHELSILAKFIISVVLFGGILTICHFFKNLKYIFSVLGSVTANMNTFILPSLFYMKFTKSKLLSVQNIIPLSFVVIGVVFMIQCNIYSIIDLGKHTGGGHGEGGH